MSRNCKSRRTQEYVMGDVFLMDFNGKGSEQSGWRPGLVLQNNVGNRYSPNIIALPLTTSLKKLHLPTHVVVNAERSGLIKDSMILCENPECMSKERIGRYITSLPDDIMRDVSVGFLIATSVVSYLGDEELLDIRQRALELNDAGVA